MLKDGITFLVYEAVQFKRDFRDMFMWMNEIHVSLYYLSLQFCCVVEEVQYTELMLKCQAIHVQRALAA